jgi:hypothetical protein
MSADLTKDPDGAGAFDERHAGRVDLLARQLR